MAAENLLIHLVNVSLVYAAAYVLWRSERAARWSAVAFALLFPANVWAVMWISTRAHLLTATFCLLAVTLTVISLRASKRRKLIAVAAAVSAVAAVFTKESGSVAVMLIALTTILVPNTGVSTVQRMIRATPIIAAAALATLFYLWLRGRSGAVAISADADTWYTYSISAKVFFSNAGEYLWRTVGLVLFLWIALAIPHLRPHWRPLLSGATSPQLLLPVLLFGASISPFILLAGRSGIYTYLPGAFAALALGAALSGERVSRIFDESGWKAYVPAACVVVILAAFTVGQTRRWTIMAETSKAVIADVRRQLPNPPKGFRVNLRYAGDDAANRFPQCFASWGLGEAMKVEYADPAADGAILKQGESAPGGQPAFEFDDTLDGGKPGAKLKPKLAE
jgi:hypothetical protein